MEDRRIVSALAALVAHWRGSRRLRSMLVTVGRAGRDRRHNRASLPCRGNRGHRGQEAYGKRFAAELMHPDESSHEIPVPDKVRPALSPIQFANIANRFFGKVGRWHFALIRLPCFSRHITIPPLLVRGKTCLRSRYEKVSPSDPLAGTFIRLSV